jgi:c-di-GMP phosphodiesterase
MFFRDLANKMHIEMLAGNMVQEGQGNGAATFYMARQPICDPHFKLHAYELLYRREMSSNFVEIGPEEEICALANVLVEVGLDRLAGNSLAFINMSAALLGSDALKLLPKDRVVLEVLEDTPWTDEVEAHLLGLKAMGYQLALDDYSFESRHHSFLPLMDVIKVDVMAMSLSELKAGMAKLSRSGQQYLAEKVETPEMYEECKRMGFDLFQGYFFSKPRTVRGSGVPANQGLSLSLLSKLQDPDVSVEALEMLIVGNIALCHKVLRLVNSAAMGLQREVDSIKQALMFLGCDRIRTLASLAVMTSMPGKPPELYNLAMIRARYCESLARASSFEEPEKHFTVGLLSVLDALTDLPMEDVLQELPLCPEVAEALQGSKPGTPCSRTLAHMLAVEQGDWQTAESNIPAVPPHLYVDSIAWAEEQQRRLAA